MNTAQGAACPPAALQPYGQAVLGARRELWAEWLHEVVTLCFRNAFLHG